MSARSFTFASLLLAAAPSAMAEAPKTHTAAAPEPGEGLPVSPRWSTSAKGNVLVAQLSLANTGGEVLDLLVRRGSSPGTYVTAYVDGEQLAPVLDRAQEREMISRMGPMPSYAPLAAGAEVDAGTFRFTLPANAKGKAIRFEASVRTADGRHVLLETRTVVGDPAV